MEVNAMRNVSKIVSYHISPVRFCSPNKRLLKCSSDKVLRKPLSNLSTPRSDRNKGVNHFLTPLVRRNLNRDLSVRENNAVICSPLKQRSPNVKNGTVKALFRDFISNEKHIPIIDESKTTVLLEEGSKENKNWSVLGNGCFGTVIRGIYQGKNVAVKIVAKDNALKSDSLVRERNALILSHPNIVKVLKVVNEPDKPHGIVIMELWHSTDMQQIIEDHPTYLDFKRKTCYIINVCQGLKYCHRESILHLDVKPKNILVNKYNNSCKLCDFGSSRKLDLKQNFYFPLQGTIKYMAPELFLSVPVTEKSDIYALGITMWQLFHEETPYKSENLDSIVYKVVAQSHRPRKDEDSLLSTFSIEEEEFMRLYESCWDKEQNLRPGIESIIKKLEMLIL